MGEQGGAAHILGHSRVQWLDASDGVTQVTCATTGSLRSICQAFWVRL